MDWSDKISLHAGGKIILWLVGSYEVFIEELEYNRDSSFVLDQDWRLKEKIGGKLRKEKMRN